MDVHKETENIDKHEEMVADVDYAHLQVNEQHDEPAPAAPQRPAPAPPAKPAVDARISHPKYWLGIVAVVVFYSIVVSYLPPLVTYAIAVCVFLLMYGSISKLLARGRDELTSKDKHKMVLYMAFVPIVGQATYFFRLKRTMPISSRISSWIGWRVLAIFIVGTLISLAVSISQSWQFRYSEEFQAHLNVISADLNVITAYAKQLNESSLIESCEKLANDAKEVKDMPDYPDVRIQDQLTTALDGLIQGATDCSRAVQREDPELLQLANNELKASYDTLRGTVKLMKTALPMV